MRADEHLWRIAGFRRASSLETCSTAQEEVDGCYRVVQMRSWRVSPNRTTDPPWPPISKWGNQHGRQSRASEHLWEISRNNGCRLRPGNVGSRATDPPWPPL